MPIFSHFDKSIFFIHIPKCGGTSLEKHLENETGNISLYNPSFLHLPCTAQHFDSDIIKSLYGSNYKPAFFTVVRHPVSRMISEYFHSTRKWDNPPNFAYWVDKKLSEFAINHYTADNHIKPQSYFLMPNTQVFKFELGLNAPLQFALKTLQLPSKPLESHEKNWKKSRVEITKETILKIEDFYHEDMCTFQYNSLIDDGVNIIFSDELKKLTSTNTQNPTLLSPPSGLPKLNKLVNNKAVNENDLVNKIRDLAFKNESLSPDIAIELLKVAKKFRSNGKIINDKLNYLLSLK